MQNFVLGNWRYLILLLISPTVFATKGHVYLSGSLGASRSNPGNTAPKIIYYSTTLTDHYPMSASHSTALGLGINVGYELFENCLRPQMGFAFGLGFYETGNYQYKGQLIETAFLGPTSTLYNYQFRINSNRLMAEAKMTWLLGHFVPFVDIGVGAAWNHLGGYRETPVDASGYISLPPFQTNTNTNVAYQLGFGLGGAFNFPSCEKKDFQHERIALGYRYANLGSASFGTRGSVYPYHLDTSNLTANEFYLIYMHLF